jgi:hypothetical protein
MVKTLQDSRYFFKKKTYDALVSHQKLIYISNCVDIIKTKKNYPGLHRLRRGVAAPVFLVIALFAGLL